MHCLHISVDFTCAAASSDTTLPLLAFIACATLVSVGLCVLQRASHLSLRLASACLSAASMQQVCWLTLQANDVGCCMGRVWHELLHAQPSTVVVMTNVVMTLQLCFPVGDAAGTRLHQELFAMRTNACLQWLHHCLELLLSIKTQCGILNCVLCTGCSRKRDMQLYDRTQYCMHTGHSTASRHVSGHCSALCFCKVCFLQLFTQCTQDTALHGNPTVWQHLQAVGPPYHHSRPVAVCSDCMLPSMRCVCVWKGECGAQLSASLNRPCVLLVTRSANYCMLCTGC